MKPVHLMRIVLLFSIAFCLNACGGGGGNGMSAGGGIGGSGIISKGTVDGFGSIVVNGTTFDTGKATLIINGETIGTGDAVIRANLDIGRVVTIEGPENEVDGKAVARQVIYRNNVEGPVETIRAIGRETKEITVMGQTVIINTLTQFKNLTFNNITLNDAVAVSGFFDDKETIWATFIQKTGTFDSGTTFEVNGVVTNLDSVEQTFRINELTVDYSLADTGDLPDGVPTEGLRVEAEGTLDPEGTKLSATKIDLEADLRAEDADEIEVTGFVTQFVSISEFMVGTQAVIIENGAEIVDGEQADIGPGIKLSAEGTLVGGILYAHEIEFWEPDQIEIEGIVTDVASDSQFSIDDQQVITTPETVFEDIEPQDIVLGILLEIKGRLREGVVVADKVSFETE